GGDGRSSRADDMVIIPSLSAFLVPALTLTLSLPGRDEPLPRLLLLGPLPRAEAHACRGADDGHEHPELAPDGGTAALLQQLLLLRLLLLLFRGQELRGRLEAEVLVDAVEDAEVGFVAVVAVSMCTMFYMCVCVCVYV
ncbi:hypothetical protein F5Y14DRAFT_401751, partial [Nemania sp. NC0429]